MTSYSRLVMNKATSTSSTCPLPLRKAKANDMDTFKSFIQAEIDWEVKSQERMAAQKEAAARAAAAEEEGAEEAAEDTPKEGEFDFSPEELEADNAAYAKLQRKLAQEMDIRLLENGPRAGPTSRSPSSRRDGFRALTAWGGSTGASRGLHETSGAYAIPVYRRIIEYGTLYRVPRW